MNSLFDTHMRAFAFAGNATEPLLYLFGLLLVACLLTGKWYWLIYVGAMLAIFAVALLYGVYLEWNVQAELERRQKEQARYKQRFGTRI